MSDQNSKVELDPLDDFDATLIELKELHDKKRADYSNLSDRFSNFKKAADYANINVYKTFEVLLGIKQARLNELMDSGRASLNESIADTLKDRAVYAILAYNWWKNHDI